MIQKCKTCQKLPADDIDKLCTSCRQKVFAPVLDRMLNPHRLLDFIVVNGEIVKPHLGEGI